MRANERKTYFANTNTSNNRFFSDTPLTGNSTSNYYTRSMRGSVASGKSFLTRVKEDPEEQQLDSGSNFNQTYGKIYADFNKNFKQKAFDCNNKKINNTNNSSNFASFLPAKNINPIAPKANFTDKIENLRYRDNNEFLIAKFREKGFDFAVREDIMDQAADLKNRKEKSHFERVAIEMIYKINFKTLTNKKHIFDSEKLANFLSDLVVANSFEEKKQTEILEFLRNFNPDKNFVNSLPQAEVRNFNARYSNREMLEILQQMVMKSDSNSDSNSTYNELLQLSRKNEILQLFKKGKKVKLEQITSKDVEMNAKGVDNTASHFNLFNYNFSSRDVGNEYEARKWGSNSRRNADELQAMGGESSGSKNNSLNKDLKSTANPSTRSGYGNFLQNKNSSQNNLISNNNNRNNNPSSNLNQNNNYKKMINNINSNNKTNILKAISTYLQSEIKSENFKIKDTLKKQTLFDNKSISSQLKENNKSMTSFPSSSRNNSNSNSKDQGANNISNNLNNNTNNNNNNFESASKKNPNLSLNYNNNNNNLSNFNKANNYEKLTTSNNSSTKTKKFKLNQLRKFNKSEQLGYKIKLHENLSSIDILNKNLMKDCRCNYHFLLNNSKSNFLKESNYQNFYVKPAIEIIPLAKRFEVLEKSGEIPILNLTETQALNQCFNKFSIISQNLVLSQKEKIDPNYPELGNKNNYLGKVGENSNYNANRIADNFNQRFSYNSNFNEFGNKNWQAKGFNASEAFKKNPFFNKQLSAKSVIHKDYNDLANRKKLLINAKAKMQITKQDKSNSINNNFNLGNSKLNSDNKSFLALNNEKHLINNLSITNFNNQNNNKKNEENGLLELNRDLHGTKSNFPFVDNFSKIDKENFVHQKNKAENNFNLVGQSPINLCLGVNSIKNNNILGKSENNASATDSSVSTAYKNLNFEINNSNFSLNTISKRNNVFKENKSILVNDNKNNEKVNAKEEENKQNILSKAFSFRDNNSKVSLGKEQIEENPKAGSNAQINEVKNSLRENYNILKASEKNIESKNQQKYELKNNLLINPQESLNKNSESNVIDFNLNKNNNDLKPEKNNLVSNPEKKDAPIFGHIKNNTANSNANLFSYFNKKKQSGNNEIDDILIESSSSNNKETHEKKVSVVEEKPNEIQVMKVNEEADFNQNLNKIIEENKEEGKNVINKNSILDNPISKNNLNNEATQPSGTSSTTIISNKNYLDVTANKNKTFSPIVNSIQDNQNVNQNLIVINKEASNSSISAGEQNSNLLHDKKLNPPVNNNIDNSKSLLNNQIPQTGNLSMTTIGLNSEKSLVNNANPFLQNLNSNPLNKIQPIGNVSNIIQAPSNTNNLAKNDNNALNPNLIANNNNINNFGSNNSNIINTIGNNRNLNNQLNQLSNNNINNKNEEMMDISTVNPNNIITNVSGINNNLNANLNNLNQSNLNTFLNSNINHIPNQNPTFPINNSSLTNPLLNPSNNPITMNNGINSNINNFNANNNLGFNNNLINNNNSNNLNNPLIGIVPSNQNVQNSLKANSNLIAQIPIDSHNSLVKPNNPFVAGKPNIGLNHSYAVINTSLNNNFQNNLAPNVNNNNNSNNLINPNNPFGSSNLNNNSNVNNNTINNTTNVFNAINSNQNNNQINSNYSLNNNLNNNLNTNTLNSAPINNNLNAGNNNSATTMFKNPFLLAGAGAQINNVSNLNPGFGSNNNNVNTFIPKSGTGNAFIVDPNKNNKQPASIFSNNPTNRNRGYYTKYN